MVPDPPSSFVVEWVGKIAVDLREPRRALDVAMGRGRHVPTLAAAGFRVFGVDRALDALRDAVGLAAARHCRVRAWCADLTAHPLPRERFDLVLVTRYLQRDLFGSLRATLTPGGALVYETFTEHQPRWGRGPTSPEHLLKPGELRASFADFEVLFYEEVVEPDALARLVARKTPPDALRAESREPTITATAPAPRA